MGGSHDQRHHHIIIIFFESTLPAVSTAYQDLQELTEESAPESRQRLQIPSHPDSEKRCLGTDK